MILLNVALTRTGPASFSIASRSMNNGSTGGTSRSSRPLAKYGRKWLKDLFMQLSNSGSLRLHGSKYSATVKDYIRLIILLCPYIHKSNNKRRRVTSFTRNYFIRYNIKLFLEAFGFRTRSMYLYLRSP